MAVLLISLCSLKSSALAQQETSTELKQLHGLVNRLLNAGMPDSLNRVISMGRELAREEGNIKELAYFTYTLGSSLRYSNEALGRTYLDSALHFSRLIDYDIGEMLVYSSLGNSNRNIGQFDSAIFYFEKSHEILLRQPDSFQKSRGLANSHQSLGLLAQDKGDFQTAMGHFVQAHKLSIDNNLIQLGNFYKYSIAKTNYNLREFDKARQGFEEVYAYADSAGNSQLMAWTSIGLAELAVTKKDYDAGLVFYHQALNIARTNGNTSLREVLFETGRLFIYREETDSARHYLAQAAELAGPEHVKTHIKLNQAYAQVFALEEEYTLAIEKVNEAIKIAKEENLSGVLAQSLKLASDIYVSSGDYKTGYDYFLDYDQLQDSLFSKENLSSINALQLEYETDLKNQKIKDLQLLALSQTSELSRKNQLLVVGLIAAVLLILLIYFVYRQRITNASNNEILAKQRLSNAQLNPHFLYNSLSAIQKLVLDNKDAVKTSRYVAKFSKLTRQMLSFTEKESISLSSEIEFLKNYLDLQKLRFGDKFEYDINVPEEIESEFISIPPMITQPFVENALEHGFASRTSAENKLRISIAESKNELTILIEDNGVGIDSSLEIEKKKEKSMAIRITKDRLKFLSKRTGKPATIDIADLSRLNPETTGTRIQLNLPIQ
ncbi:MAG: histidine kinase [Roseivirga sp.]|nr:histidine kinase [Roseivirga sp.]